MFVLNKYVNTHNHPKTPSAKAEMKEKARQFFPKDRELLLLKEKCLTLLSL